MQLCVWVAERACWGLTGRVKASEPKNWRRQERASRESDSAESGPEERADEPASSTSASKPSPLTACGQDGGWGAASVLPPLSSFSLSLYTYIDIIKVPRRVPTDV